MFISPQRRRRILQAHQLRQEGRTLRGIAEILGVSHSTVVADLKLFEIHWSDLVEQAADDALVEQLQLLQVRLRKALPLDMIETYGNFNPTDFARVYQAHVAEVATVLREIRRTTVALHERAQSRRAQQAEHGQSAEAGGELSFPVDELANAPAQPAKSTKPATSGKSTKRNKPDRRAEQAGQDRPGRTNADHTKRPNSSKTRRIDVSPGRKNNSRQPDPQPAPVDAMIRETIELFPHLKGKPIDQILDFLERFTDPNGEPPHIPAVPAADPADIQAAAAG